MNSVTGTVLIDQFGNQNVILNSTPTPYDLYFTYFGNNGPTYDPLPPIWRQILDTFTVLPATQ